MNNFKITAHITVSKSYNIIDNRPIDVSSFIFSGGEIQVKCRLPEILPDYIKIFAKLYSSDDIMKLFLITDALRHKYHYTPIHVEIPYLPYARQDRVCALGEAFSLSVIANLINSQNYASVTVWDPHSKETNRLINNLKVRGVHEFVKKIPKAMYTYIIAPDKGSMNKAKGLGLRFNKPVIYCTKYRDPNNGELSSVKTDIISPLGNVNLLIIDDICDGGRTFINLAKELKKYTTGKIYLYVTHGIFSQGLDPLIDAGIDHIYCPHIWPDYFPSWRFKTRNNIWDRLTEIK